MDELAKLKKRYLDSRIEIRNESETEEIHIPIKTESLLLFDAKYNTSTLQTIFDTGSSYLFFTDKKNAEKAGIKMMEPYNMSMMNGIEMSSAAGWIDSIRIGSLLIKNVPVYVVENGLFTRCIPDSILNDREKKAKADSIFDQFQMIMGTPFIQMLNHIRLNLPEKEMIISLNRKDAENKNSNMYIGSHYLYLNLKANGMDFTAFFDTGGNIGKWTTVVNNRFYQAHKDIFPVAASKENKGENSDLPKQCWIHEVSTVPSFSKPQSFILSINDKQMDVHEETVILNTDSDLSSFSFPFQKDGYLSFEFLKKFKELTFDFHNMLLDGVINEE